MNCYFNCIAKSLNISKDERNHHRKFKYSDGERIEEMKPSLLEILCCPKCKGDLELHVFESDEKSGEILSGDLYCKNCDIHFPIEDGIPNMLLPEQREE